MPSVAGLYPPLPPDAARYLTAVIPPDAVYVLRVVHSVLWCDLGCSSRTVVLVKAAMNPRQRLFYVDWVAV